MMEWRYTTETGTDGKTYGEASACRKLTPMSDVVGVAMELAEEALGRYSKLMVAGRLRVTAVQVRLDLEELELEKDLTTGGIATGPIAVGEHGTETFVPLPDGKRIPVEIPDGPAKEAWLNIATGDPKKLAAIIANRRPGLVDAIQSLPGVDRAPEEAQDGR